MSGTIQFDSTASRPKNGLALIYDLEGFSKFYNQPDVQDYIPKYLNEVGQVISTIIYGGDSYWKPETKTVSSLSPAPIHEKFLGDGALYLWADSKDSKITTSFVVALCNRIWNLERYFIQVVKKCHEFVPVVDIPQRIRFGLATGTIYELKRKNTKQKEYIGFCINLASRLQKYCPELGFIASARIGVSNDTLTKHGYIKVVAKEIRGFPREIVIVQGKEYEALAPEIKSAYFEAS
jgi:class 3 adenylate cyclase